jgi:hypothetical protein
VTGWGCVDRDWPHEPVGDLTSRVEERGTFLVRLRVRLLGQDWQELRWPKFDVRALLGYGGACPGSTARLGAGGRGLLIRSALGSMREYAAPASDG